MLVGLHEIGANEETFLLEELLNGNLGQGWTFWGLRLTPERVMVSLEKSKC